MLTWLLQHKASTCALLKFAFKWNGTGAEAGLLRSETIRMENRSLRQSYCKTLRDESHRATAVLTLLI